VNAAQTYSVTDLESSRADCRSVTRHHARSFYFSSVGLPSLKRAAAYSVYAFCRHADDLVDEAPDLEALPAALEELSLEFDRCREGASQLPFAPSLQHSIHTYGLEKQPFMELIEGVARDQGPVRLETWEELRDYCYHVASTVGLIMCPILGLSDSAGTEHAIDLGIAMQLTNISRDVGEDLGRDRIYLPAEELDRFGVREADLIAGRITDPFRELMKFQVDRARDYYRRSEAGIPLLAADGSQFTVWLMRTIYADILDQLEAIDYDCLNRRAATTTPRKIRLAARAYRKARVSARNR